MANKRIKDLTERTTLAAGDYLATDNDNGTRKVNASKILTAISTAQSTADNVATKVSNSGDAFSSSKGYSVGELCIYNNKVYRCKTAYSTGASWSSRSSNFEQVTLTDAITDLNNDLNNYLDGWEDVFCIIRKVNGSWEILDDANHSPKHVDSISIDNNGYLRVTFDKTYSDCGCAFVTDDETFGINGGVYGVTLGKDSAGILGGIARPISGCVKINNVNGTCSIVSGLAGDLKSVELLPNGYFKVSFADRIAGFTPVAASVVNVGGGSIYNGGYTITLATGAINIVPLASTGGDVMVSVMVTIPFTNFANYPDNPTANLFFYAKMKV